MAPNDRQVLQSDFLTMSEGAQHYRFPSARTFRAWCQRDGVPLIRRGKRSRMLLVLVRHVEAHFISMETGRPIHDTKVVRPKRAWPRKVGGESPRERKQA